MVSSRAPCSCRASSRLSATPTAPNPATNTVDPSRTPATASAVVFTCLSITSKSSLEQHCCLASVAYAGTKLGGNRPSTPAPRKTQICSRGAHRLPMRSCQRLGNRPGEGPDPILRGLAFRVVDAFFFINIGGYGSGVRRDDDYDFTMTFATKMVVAKSCPRAS